MGVKGTTKSSYARDYDFYQHPANGLLWDECPNCGLKPKIWVFDNGRFTMCGCVGGELGHFSIRAESILSYYKNSGRAFDGYDTDGLRKNWNHWCITGEILFDQKRDGGGRW